MSEQIPLSDEYLGQYFAAAKRAVSHNTHREQWTTGKWSSPVCPMGLIGEIARLKVLNADMLAALETVDATAKDLVSKLKGIHGALCDALGDSDIEYMDDDELRDSYPVQWAAMKLAGIIVTDLTAALAVADDASPCTDNDADLPTAEDVRGILGPPAPPEEP